MSAARIVLLPSRWEEPGGLVALEAMALGTPVVCYARGGLAEYVSDAGGGRIVEQSAEALASACAQLYGDADLWTRMSESGREAIARNQSPEAYLDRLVPVYERVRRSHGPSYV